MKNLGLDWEVILSLVAYQAILTTRKKELAMDEAKDWTTYKCN